MGRKVRFRRLLFGGALLAQLLLSQPQEVGNLNTFQKAEGDAYKKGEEALVDCLLLSRCDFLLKCTSHLSESSMYFNPKLECIDMNYVD